MANAFLHSYNLRSLNILLAVEITFEKFNIFHIKKVHCEYCFRVRS